MRRKIRPAEEEIRGLWYTLGFLAMWYMGLFSVIQRKGFSVEISLFLLAGLMPLGILVQNFRRAHFYRKQRAEALQKGQGKQGRIVGLLKESVPYETQNSGRRYRNYYYLKVEVYDGYNGGGREVKSQGYSKPIHRYLRSPNVTVYTDESGWKYFLEDFEWKESREDPDIFPFQKEFEESEFTRIIFGIVFFGVLAVSIIRAFFR